MNIVMDFRKYDGIVGGVEQVVSQIISQIAPKGHTFILLSKQNRLDEVKDLFHDIPNIKHLPLPVQSHAISMKNAWHDSNTIQDIAESENAPVIHFPYNWSFPYKKKAKTILTIHDVIPFELPSIVDAVRLLVTHRAKGRIVIDFTRTEYQ